MRYEGRRPKTCMTVLGEMTLMRAYYHGDTCKGSPVPRDRALLMDQTSLSPGVTRMTGLAAAMASFEEGSLLLSQLAGVRVGARQVEEAPGRQIAHDERTYVAPDDPGTPTRYPGVDGTGIPVRQNELLGRKGTQADGSAKTREVKLCTVWSAEDRDKEGRPVRDKGSITYSAAIESAASNPMRRCTVRPTGDSGGDPAGV